VQSGESGISGENNNTLPLWNRSWRSRGEAWLRVMTRHSSAANTVLLPLCILNSATTSPPSHLMTSIGTEQVRCESLLKPYTEAISLFRKQYRLYRSIPGVQRTITDGELMAACAFRTYEQCVFHVLFKTSTIQPAQTPGMRQTVRGGNAILKAMDSENRRTTKTRLTSYRGIRRTQRAIRLCAFACWREAK